MTNDRSPPQQRVWTRYPQKNHGSMYVTIPAAIRRALNWHQNAPFVLTQVGDHMEVRQVDVLQTTVLEKPTLRLKRRRKHWSKGPQEPSRRDGGYPLEEEESSS